MHTPSSGLFAGSAAICAAALACLCGCLSPERAEKEADETAQALATDYWRRHTGLTNSFDVARPADALTLRLAFEALRSGRADAAFPRLADLAPLVPSNGTVRLSLDHALALGARNNRRYQTLKETVYTRALTLDSARHTFETSFSGLLLGALAGNPEVTAETAEAGAGATRKFEQGASVAGNLAVDVAKMIRDDWHSFAWTGDLTVSIPLLRGSGRDIVREPLTQAERDLAYALLEFERYRQTHALAVTRGYYSVLRNAQTHRNSADNALRLEQNWKRAEMMFRAGRMDRIQSDQAKTDLLSARQTTITSRQSYEDALDAFKITLGLAPETPVTLMDEELAHLQAEMENRAATQKDARAGFPAEDAALGLGLANRRDLIVKAGDVEDAERAVAIAADQLRADLTLEGGAAYKGKRRQHHDTDDETETSLKAKFDPPWDRRRERNAYRKALLARDQAVRTFEEAEDEVKNEIRAGYRSLVAARVLYENKVESLKTARLRVEANDLFTQSGRSTMRDILEAEAALLSARNALCSAVIDWRMSELALRSALGVLEVDDNGRWQ